MKRHTVEVGLPGNPGGLRERGPVANVLIRAPEGAFPERVQALVSTETAESSIDAATARRLGLSVGENEAGSAAATAWIEIDGLGWPRMTRRLHETPRAQRYALVIGMDLLRHVELDYNGITGSMKLTRDATPGSEPPPRNRDLGSIDWAECPDVQRNPAKMSGAWCFGDTRMPVSALFINLASGMTIPEFHKTFPGTPTRQVRGVLKFIAERLEATATD